MHTSTLIAGVRACPKETDDSALSRVISPSLPVVTGRNRSLSTTSGSGAKATWIGGGLKGDALGLTMQPTSTIESSISNISRKSSIKRRTDKGLPTVGATLPTTQSEGTDSQLFGRNSASSPIAATAATKTFVRPRWSTLLSTYLRTVQFCLRQRVLSPTIVEPIIIAMCQCSGSLAEANLRLNPLAGADEVRGRLGIGALLRDMIYSGSIGRTTDRTVRRILEGRLQNGIGKGKGRETEDDWQIVYGCLR